MGERTAGPDDGGNDRPRVSVVVPVHNAADEIARTVESLTRLDYPAGRMDIVVVDNGSTDDTAAVASRFPGVTVASETGIQSSYAARNRGVAVTGGDWLAFTDADCVADPGWLRRMLAPPLDDDVGAVAGEVRALEGTTPVQRLTERYGLMKHAVTMHHKAIPCFSTANVAIRRDVLERLGGFRTDTRFFGDMELSWRMHLELGRRILFRPDAVILHRHRRTWGELWRHGLQHGRGVAYMKARFPDRYRIHPGEQLRRLAGLAGAMGKTLVPSRGDAPKGDRFLAPLFLALWYAGLGTGYLMGPARSDRIDTGRAGP